MQENSNFDTIISKWRRLSAVEKKYINELSSFSSMSGDSTDCQTLLKAKTDEANLLVPESTTSTPLAAMSTGIAATVSSDIPPDTISVGAGDKQEFIKNDEENSKEEADDTDTKNKDNNENVNCEKATLTETEKDPVLTTEKEKLVDNVDSVFLRSPPPHKTRSMASTQAEEEDCGIKCLYYTLQCCDCVIM